jgi:hypothetical protein
MSSSRSCHEERQSALTPPSQQHHATISSPHCSIDITTPVIEKPARPPFSLLLFLCRLNVFVRESGEGVIVMT